MLHFCRERRSGPAQGLRKTCIVPDSGAAIRFFQSFGVKKSFPAAVPFKLLDDEITLPFPLILDGSGDVRTELNIGQAIKKAFRVRRLRVGHVKQSREVGTLLKDFDQARFVPWRLRPAQIIKVF
jgi:hypothetical protein